MKISIDKNTAGAEIARLISVAQRPRALTAAGGRAMANFLKRHFRELNKTNPNKLLGKRQNFWLQVGRSVQNPVINEKSCSVTVSDPRYMHKVKGGRIKPKDHDYLAIPIVAEAYGRRPAVFEQATGKKLTAIGHEGKGVLAEVVKGKVVKAYYVLKTFVKQDPFPGALPNMEAMAADALQHVRNAAARQVRA